MMPMASEIAQLSFFGGVIMGLGISLMLTSILLWLKLARLEQLARKKP